MQYIVLIVLIVVAATLDVVVVSSTLPFYSKLSVVPCFLLYGDLTSKKRRRRSFSNSLPLEILQPHDDVLFRNTSLLMPPVNTHIFSQISTNALPFAAAAIAAHRTMDTSATSTGDTKKPPGDESAIEALVGSSLGDGASPVGLDEGASASPAIGSGVGGAGSGRLSALVPTLGRMATRAHKASAPYLTYAAMASQEAARCARAVEGLLWICSLLMTAYTTHIYYARVLCRACKHKLKRGWPF